jgi:hypothetical protein
VNGKLRLSVMAAVVAVLLLPAAAPGQVVIPVAELITNPEGYAGQRVSVRGELIGDYGFRANGYMWTQLNDDSYAREPVAEGGLLSGGNIGIGIRMPDDLGRTLDPPGGYRLRGPIVLVSGIFAYHDPGRQGETFIDVTEIEVQEPGRPIDEGLEAGVLLIGGGLIFVALLIHWWRRRLLARV